MLRIDAHLLLTAIEEAEGRRPPFRRRIAKSHIAWLQEVIPDKSYVAFLVENGLCSEYQACCNYLYGPKHIVEWTSMYRTINKTYVILGGAANGDFIAVPRAEWDRIGYISHEEFDYDQGPRVPFVSVSDSIGEFYYNTWHVDGYPCDYYGTSCVPRDPKGRS